MDQYQQKQIVLRFHLHLLLPSFHINQPSYINFSFSDKMTREKENKIIQERKALILKSLNKEIISLVLWFNECLSIDNFIVSFHAQTNSIIALWGKSKVAENHIIMIFNFILPFCELPVHCCWNEMQRVFNRFKVDLVFFLHKDGICLKDFTDSLLSRLFSCFIWFLSFLFLLARTF